MSERIAAALAALVASGGLLSNSTNGLATPLLLPGEEPAATTEHHVKASGRLLNYTAEVGRVAIRDVETGEPHGYMGYVAYRMDVSGTARPIMFLWNGGPGADSALLHFELAGPKRADGDHLVDNAETWLTAADLVFVDPIGTGFSRPAKAEYADEFYGTVGDVDSVAEFVRAWRLLHDAQEHATFLVGESWGAPRAASVGASLLQRGISVDGLVLISGGTGLTQTHAAPALTAALRVIDMAQVALHHRKSAAELGTDREAIARAAEDWARRSYAPALARIDNLSAGERTMIAEKLAHFTGIPVAQIDRKTLIVTPRQFRNELLKEQGKTLYLFDMRRVSALPTHYEPAVLRYLRGDLGHRTSLPYIGLEPVETGYAPHGKYPESVNSRWNYATGPVTPEMVKEAMAAASKSGDGPPRLGPPLPGAEAAMALNPKLKILVASGLYDGGSICAANDEIARSLPDPLQQAMEFKCYAGGHMLYRDEPARMQFTRDVKAFVAAGRR